MAAAPQAIYPNTIIMEEEEEYREVHQFGNSKCFCFRAFPCLGIGRQRRHDTEHDHAHLLQGGGHNLGTNTSTKLQGYLKEKLKEFKEWTEVVSGPKWKNLLRRLGSRFSISNKRKCSTTATYDSYSYALNFDDGLNMDQQDIDDEANERFTRGFSARYTAAPLHNQNHNHNKQQIGRS